jgi:hypothetical protein
MARITSYQQGQLASSLVGTPGQYTGVSSALGQIGSSIAPLQNTVYNLSQALFQDELATRRQKEAELRAYDRQLKTAEQEAYVAERTSSLDKDFTDISLDIQNKSQFNTNTALPEFQQRAKEAAEAALEQEKDPLVQAQLRKAIANKTAQYQDRLNNWIQDRQVPIMKSNVESISGNFALKVGHYELGAAEVGKAYQQYVSENARTYDFVYGPQGRVKMREDMANGIKEYLSSTALNAPDMLEDRIKAFSGGSMIDVSDLNKFAIEQRRIANEIKMTQLAEEKKDQLHSQLQAGEEILNSSPTGDWRDADPATVQQVRKKYGPKLTNEQNIRFAQLEKQAAEQQKETAKKKVKTAAEQESEYTERVVADSFRGFAASETALAGRIEAQIAGLYTKGLSKEEKQKRIAKLQIDVDQYQDAYLGLHAVKGSIKNKNIRDLAELHVIQSKERFGSILASVGKQKSAQEAKQIKNDLYSKVYPPSMFSDAKKQGLFTYLYKSYYYDTLNRANTTPEKMKVLTGSDTAITAFRNTLKKKAYQKMLELGVIRP